MDKNTMVVDAICFAIMSPFDLLKFVYVNKTIAIFICVGHKLKNMVNPPLPT